MRRSFGSLKLRAIKESQPMKIKTVVNAILAAALAVSLAACASSESKQARLEARAKISRADAEKTALTKAPNGTVKEGELEEEHGKLIWSFDIATPGTKDITEVAVDAITGEIVSVENETPEQQAKEKAEDSKKEKN
jgi:uncharacterized membrane protein YkoI